MRYRVGDYVTWHSRKKKRHLIGQIVQFLGHGRVMIVWYTWDGRSHHWIEPISKIRPVNGMKYEHDQEGIE